MIQRTLAEITAIVNDPESKISAHDNNLQILKDLRVLMAASASGGGSSAAIVAQLQTLETALETIIEQEGDETQAKHDALAALQQLEHDQTQVILGNILLQLQDVPNSSALLEVTTTLTTGNGLRGIAATLIGGGPDFDQGSGSMDGIDIPLGMTPIAVDGDGKQPMANDHIYSAAGGARWIILIKS